MMNLFKWTHCFVACTEDGHTRLVTMPYHTFFLIKIFYDDRKNFRFVPPWKIHFGDKVA